MTKQIEDLTEVPTKQSQFEVQGAGDVLHSFLTIHPPDDASTAPPILSFKRKREVEIPWGEIVRDVAAATGAEGIKAIRMYFEESWGLDVNKEWWKDPAHHLLDTGAGPWCVKQITKEKPVYRTEFATDPLGGPVTEGFVIRHGTSGRLYRLILTNSERPLAEPHFQTFDAYENAWATLIDGVELVFESSEDAKKYYMDYEEIDLRPAIIQRRHAELCILRDFARKVKSSVAGVTEKMISQITATTLDVDELEQLQRKVLRLEIDEYDVQRRIERLASDAARLGFLLFIEAADREITYADGKKAKLTPGKLYTTVKRTARWIQYETVRFPVQVGWIFRWTVMREVKVPRPQEKVVEDYQLLDTSKDILLEKRSALTKAGHQVYVFEQTPSGLVSTEGEPLRQVMDRCKHDETFRRHCVVMLPVYEESLTGQRLVAKYAIYNRPLPGLVPTILPRLSLEESLTYRTAWVRMQLGELLNSINLAPDEERKVTITKRFEQETTVTRTSTSIFDVSRAETSDLATEMENQTRQEQESSKSLQFSTKASGGYGPFSAEASASGGTSSSLKDMSQAISKVATKAAKSLSSQNREEVSSTSTARTTISNTDETVATIRNINQGRSLNLMFYRLYNKYQGGLFLEDLRFDVIPSVEVIAGSGVHESRSYSLEELPRLIDEFKAAQLPFAVKDEETYTGRLVESIETLLSREYAVDSGTGSDASGGADPQALKLSRAGAPREVRTEGTSVGRLSLPPPKVSPPRRQAGRADADAKLAGLSDRLRRAAIHSNDPIAPQELLVAASGLYLDAVVGALPSTEPYSEQMRTQEVRMRAAEVSVKESESAYHWAMAMGLAHMRPADGANCLTGVLPGSDQRSLALSLRMPLLAGDWQLQVDGKEKATVETTDVSRHIIAFSWNEPQTWLSPESLLSRIALVNPKSGDTIVYPA